MSRPACNITGQERPAPAPPFVRALYQREKWRVTAAPEPHGGAASFFDKPKTPARPAVIDGAFEARPHSARPYHAGDAPAGTKTDSANGKACRNPRKPAFLAAGTDGGNPFP